jgi:hypothetical protein
MMQGACVGLDNPEVMFPSTEAETRDAKRVCLGCTVRPECLAAAMEEEGSTARATRHGVRGGLDPDERYDLRPRRIGGSNGPRDRHTGGKPPAPCGTRSAAERHIRRKEPVDGPCEDALRRYRADKAAKKRAKKKASRDAAREAATIVVTLGVL